MIADMRTAPLLLTTLLLAGCGGSGVVEITDAWAGSMPPSAETAAIYLTIENGTSGSVRIAEVTSPRCGAVEIHESRLDDQQVMRMRPASDEAITVASGDTLEMTPGALHVMCIDVQEHFEVGDEFDLELDLDDGATLAASVTVENR